MQRLTQWEWHSSLAVVCDQCPQIPGHARIPLTILSALQDIDGLDRLIQLERH